MPQKLITVGISHHSVPVELREKLVFSDVEIRSLLERLRVSISDEALLISTCNRTELYARASHDELTSEYLIDFLLGAKPLSEQERTILKSYFQKLGYCDSILHLFEVVSGIDSQIVGDQQIFSQVKEAFRLSDEAGMNGTFMTKLAHAAFRVAKRVRSETNIISGAGTISYAAVEFARKVYADLRQKTAMIVGAGDTAEIAAKHLLDKGIQNLIIANRTLENANGMLHRLELPPDSRRTKVVSLEEIPSVLSNCDIVITSTSTDTYVLFEADIRSAMDIRRSGSPLVLVDIAVPRDIEPSTSSVPNVFLKDIDDLTDIVNQNIEKRRNDIPTVKQIVIEEFKEFLERFSRLEVAPTIKDLREKFENIRLEEIERHSDHFSQQDLELINNLTRKIINRLLHTPTVMLKEPHSSKDDLQARIELVRALFALENSEKEEDKF